MPVLEMVSKLFDCICDECKQKNPKNHSFIYINVLMGHFL